MKKTLHQALLASTALAVAGSFSLCTPGKAWAATLTLTDDATWGTAANGMVATPTSGDNVVIPDTKTLKIDGSKTVRVIGAITSTGTGAVTITTATDADVTTTIGSIAITGAGDITQSLTNKTNRSIATTVTGNVSTGGNLVMTNLEGSGTAVANTMNIGGTLTVAGTTSITSGGAALATTALTVTADATFTDAVTVAGSMVGTTSNATLELKGATNTATKGITLTDNAGQAILVFNGTSAQTLTGDITAGSPSNGTITVKNNVKVVGQIGGTAVVGAMTIATGKTFTLQTTKAANAIDTTTIAGTGTFVYDTTNAGTASTLTGAVAAAADGAGTLKFTGAQDAIITKAVGTNAKKIGRIAVNGLATGKEVIFVGNVYANGVSIDATNATDKNMVTFGSGAADTLAIMGNITSAENGEHTLVFNSSTAATVTGNIGALGAAFKAVTLVEGLTVSGNLYATDATIANTKTLTLTGTAATVSANIAGAVADSDGTIVVGDGTASSSVTFRGAIGDTREENARNSINTLAIMDKATATFSNGVESSTITIAAGGTFTTSGALTVTSATAFNNSGTMDLGGTLTLGGTSAGVDLGGSTTTSNNKIILAKASAYTKGVIIKADTVNVGATNAVIVMPHATFTSGTLTLVDVTTGDNAASTKYTVSNTVLATYAVSGGGADTDLTLTATRRSEADIAAQITGLTTEEGSALGEAASVMGNSTDTAMVDAFNTIVLNGSTVQKQTLAKQIKGGDGVGGASSMSNTSTGNSTQTNNTLSARLDGLRDGTNYAAATGFAGGGNGLTKSAWIKPYTYQSSQGTRNGASGYDSSTYGFIAGVDAMVLNAIRLGVAAGYANTDVDNDGIERGSSDIDSWQVTLYGDYAVDRWYVEGMLGYAKNNADTSRIVELHGTNTIKGKYDLDQFNLRIGGGMPVNMNGHIITPHAGLQYTRLSGGAYTETGHAALVQRVDIDSTDVALGILGVKYHTHIKAANGGTIKPELRAGMSYDLAGDEVSSTNIFTGGGASFKVTGADVAKLGGNVGLGLAFNSPDSRWTLGAAYDADFKANYLGHTGQITAKLHF